MIKFLLIREIRLKRSPRQETICKNHLVLLAKAFLLETEIQFRIVSLYAPDNV
jgi:hypothetical protein